MAIGVQRTAHADIGIAITGATGPSAGEKAAGLTFVAVAGASPEPVVRRLTGDLGAGRNAERAVRIALELGERVVAGSDRVALPGDAA